jgi:hypothetical protein
MFKAFFRAVVFSVFAIASALVVPAQTLPRVFVLNSKNLQATKQKFANAKTIDPILRSTLAKLERDAQKALKTEVQPITAKAVLPPSGDKHDYMTQAPYFWKNPATKDGLPYIRKDGERNPEIKNFPDHELLDKMEASVNDLALAYYFIGKEEYAAKAGDVLRSWFLDPKTKMNPNLEYAQAVPGQNTGRGIGLIETRGLIDVVDSIGLLSGSKSWTTADQKGVEMWFGQFLKWMIESKNGKDESNSQNNHGSYYDAQIISYALFSGKPDLAKTVLETAKQKRIAKQIDPDGKQPLELARTKSWSYSTMNLEGLVELAELGDTVGVDLWNYQSADGRSIRRAFDFLYPFAVGEKKWTYKQIEEFKAERLFELMRRASAKFTDDQFKKMMASVPKPSETAPFYLTGH